MSRTLHAERRSQAVGHEELVEYPDSGASVELTTIATIFLAMKWMAQQKGRVQTVIVDRRNVRTLRDFDRFPKSIHCARNSDRERSSTIAIRPGGPCERS